MSAPDPSGRLSEPRADAAGGRRSLVIVAGSGRSGTSLFTGLADRLGYRIPLPEVKADGSNPTGFGEPRWAVDFHDELLASIAVNAEDGRPEAWAKAAQACERPRAQARVKGWLGEQFAASDKVVVKDPRLSWFLTLYRLAADQLDADLSVVTMLRHPAESIKSRELAYGSGSAPTTRMVGWLNMMLGTEAATRDLSRAIVTYDGLLADWKSAFTDALDGALLAGATPGQIGDADELVDPSLRRAEPTWEGLGLPPSVRELAEHSYDALDRLAAGKDAAAELDDLRERFSHLYSEAELIARSSARGARMEGRRAGLREAPQQAAPTPQPDVRRVARRVVDGVRRRIKR
ncbi:MAG: sulfotransferase family protein [Nocardioides sp.]